MVTCERINPVGTHRSITDTLVGNWGGIAWIYVVDKI